MSAADNKGWPQGPVDSTTGGMVRMPTRDELMQDARRGKWQTIETLPCDRDTIITRGTAQLRPIWLLQRLRPGEAPFIYGQRATHWCEDTLGTPLATPAASG